METITDAIRNAGGSITEGPKGLTVRVNPGPRARTTTLDQRSLGTLLSVTDEVALKVMRRAFARGLVSALTVPKHIDAESIEFAEAAATILPVVEHRAFADGLRAAGAPDPFERPLFGELRVYFEVELDDGVHVITERQVARWGCTADRVLKAAISILFHRSWGCSLVGGEEHVVLRASGRDGRDAARLLIADIWAPEVMNRAVYIAVPSLDDLMVCPCDQDTGAEQIRSLAALEFARARAPLSESVFRLVAGKFQPS